MIPTKSPVRRLFLAMTVALVALTAGCNDGSKSKTSGSSTQAPPSAAGAAVIDPGDGGNYQPRIDPANFVETIDNPYMPLAVGSKRVYEGTSDGEPERVEVVVTPDRREVMGVSTIVVRDTVYVNNKIVEDTYDWFAQDRDGNVWYFGEDVKDYKNGKVTSTAGSWEGGVNGAVPGIVMPAKPAVGDAYRQEFFAGEAEDMAEIIALGGTATTPAGTFDHVITTRDWTPLEPEVVEEKQYAPGVGEVIGVHTAGGEGRIELVELTPGA